MLVYSAHASLARQLCTLQDQISEKKENVVERFVGKSFPVKSFQVNVSQF